jgi:hypothetical protein
MPGQNITPFDQIMPFEQATAIIETLRGLEAPVHLGMKLALEDIELWVNSENHPARTFRGVYQSLKTHSDVVLDDRSELELGCEAVERDPEIVLSWAGHNSLPGARAAYFTATLDENNITKLQRMRVALIDCVCHAPTMLGQCAWCGATWARRPAATMRLCRQAIGRHRSRDIH